MPILKKDMSSISIAIAYNQFMSVKNDDFLEKTILLQSLKTDSRL